MNFEAHAHLSSNYRKHTAANPVQRALIERFHRKIVTEITALEPDSFLDAGCGEGFVAEHVLRTLPGVNLTGCDVSDSALAIAARANPGARFVAGSVVALPFPDQSFDVVGCFEVLEHLPGDLPRQALSELARVARQGVVLSVPHEPLFCLANAARGKNLDVRPRGSDPNHKQFWTRSAFGRLVSEQLHVRRLEGSFPWTICVAGIPER
ncbi:MAG: class I SAM-dependent methyltransferase [Thermomicrobiales bacterium]